VGSKLYLAGGRTLTDDLITAIDVYDPVLNSWTTPFFWTNATATSDGAAFGYKELLFIVGGYTASYDTPGVLTSLNTVTGIFSTNYPVMPTGRGDISVLPYNGDFYVFGGWSATESTSKEGVYYCNPLKKVEKYSPDDNKWSNISSMLFGRGDLAVGLMGDLLFAVGGEAKKAGDASCTFSVPVKYAEHVNGATGKSFVEDESKFI
jgi:N-acetylneuraminic acid mutarotase